MNRRGSALRQQAGSSSLRFSPEQTSAIQSTQQSFRDIARVFEEQVEVTDRRYRMRTYKDCFLGADAVTLLHEILRQFDGVIYSRAHATHLGRHLAKKFNLFSHVTNDHLLSDDYLMYRFTDQETRIGQPLPSHRKQYDQLDDQEDTSEYLANLVKGILEEQQGDDHGAFDEVSAIQMMADSITLQKHGRSRGPRASFTSSGSSIGRRRNRFDQKRSPSPTSTDDLDNEMYDFSLEHVAQAFEDGIEVKTHRYRDVIYAKTFVGNDAVNFLLSCRYASSRGAAVRLGQALMTELNLFRPSGGTHDFEDNYVFYSFTAKGERKDTDNKSSRSQIDAGLEEIARKFEAKVDVRNRNFRLRNYKSCFIGNEAVTCLMKVAKLSDRQSALALGREIASKFNLFQHVTGDHALEDDYLFYRFVEEDGRKNIDATKDEKGLRNNKTVRSHMYTMEAVPDISTTELMAIGDTFRKNIETTTHVYRLKRYRICFVGSEAVDFLVNTDMVACRRSAVLLGRRLSEEIGLFRHVKKAHRFADDRLFFRFSEDEELDVTFSDRQTPRHQLERLASSMRREVQTKTRRWYHRVYRNCFLGSEAVSYLLSATNVETRPAAVQLGRDLARQCKLFEHVEGDHELKDEKLFYRFIDEESPVVKHDVATLRKLADQFVDSLDIKDHRYRLRRYQCTFVGEEAVKSMVQGGIARSPTEAVSIGRELATTFNLFEHVTREHEFSDEFLFFRLIPESERLSWDRDDKKDVRMSTVALTWEQKILQFESKSKTGVFQGRISQQISRPLLWASTFRRLDPRWRILEYFNEVAQLGVESVVKGVTLSSVHPLLRFVSRASVFSVWRPTGNDAIRKLMKGEAVGKGLDIKGKSAKRGKLSGFVPFLQISENRHKQLVRTIPRGGKVRLFFGDDSFYERERVVDVLEKVAEEMMETVGRAREILSGDREGDIEDAKESLLWDMEDPDIGYIDDYSPHCYGLEIPVRLFWEAYIARKDISRKPLSQYDTGRVSLPGFQDFNVASLLAKPVVEDGPKAVLFQTARKSDIMNPKDIVMAYEEIGRVLPVASDFDGFLVGTRRVRYDPSEGALPEEQLEVLQWCMNKVQEILDGPTRPDSWSNRWLEVLRDEREGGFHPRIPRFGFGDPRSYSVMENAVNRLVDDGAVRHGAESFNYYFPQEMDERFLVISDSLGKVPWAYMDIQELQEFLLDRIEKGFTFPLNPKWIVCDPGWKPIYDRLLASENEDVLNSMNIWFPPESGIREKIDELCSRYPYGFERGMRK